ncbi:MAG: prolyl oligopeptidase family serine peptidase [Planctomycetota bacterium]
MRRLRSAVVLFVGLLAPLSVGQAPAAGGPARLSPELLLDLARVSDPQPSPDGSKLLYSVRTVDLAANKSNGQLFVLDLQSGTRHQLTSGGSNGNGCWSPDGQAVGFVSDRSGSPQIWRIALDGGEAQQVTRHDGGVANIAWSPDGAHFSFTADVKLVPDLHDRYPDLPKAQAAVYDDLMVRHWNVWNDGTFSHLFVVPASGGEATDLMEGLRVDTPLKPFGGGEQIAWSPDGRTLCYTAKVGPHEEASTDSSLFLVAVDDAAHHQNLTPKLSGFDIEPRFSPDGKKIAFLSMARNGYESDKNRLMLLDRPSGQITDLTDGFDQSAHDPVWTSDGLRLLFASETLGTSQIYRVEAGGGAPQAVTRGRYEFSSPRVAADGRALFALRQQTERPNEIVRLRLLGEAGEGVAVTDENGGLYKGLALPKVEERWTKATDGKRILSWVVYPPGFDPSKKYPMLLYCQGGPQSQVGQWFSFRWNFHLMAAQGYIVLAVNRRGLPGFGGAWNEQISGDWGGQAMQDLLSACDDLRQEAFVDKERVAAVGASFGGYTVYWLMGNGGDRFCTMVAHCGVFNLEAMYHATEELWFVNWDLGGPYWKDAAIKQGYDRFSPHRFIQNWKTPLMVIHGEKDFRVPVTEGLQAFSAARVRDIPARFLYFPTEGHWVLSPQNGVLWHREFFRWLDQWCKPETKERTGQAAAPARDNVLERVDDVQVLQLFADGFEELDLDDKLLCYHLAQAAIAGRDICIDQRYRHNLAIKDLLEELYLHKEALPADLQAEVARYTKAFWIHNGIHHNYSTDKMLLHLSRDQLRLAARLVAARGGRMPNEAEVDRLHAILTDPNRDRSVTDKASGEGKDALVASCNNLYVDVTTADLQGFEERYPLNSRLVKRDGKLIEEVYRAGDGSVPPGLYAKQIEAIVGHLTEALAYAPPKTKSALEKLIRYYRTGEPADWRAFNIAWVQDNDSVVDNVNGFVEVYLDARGQKGAWQGLVSFKNKVKTRDIEALAAQAQWFENHMPWAAEFKKKDVKGISARAISVICETGDVGPITPIGVNLPNEADIRQEYGSKSVNLANVVEGYNLASKGGGAAGEFAWDAAEVARAKRWLGIVDDIHTNLHEVVGHASGQVRAEVTNPAQRLGVYYSTLEEGRADLVGLYWIGHDEAIARGFSPSAEAALAQYEAYARNALVQLRRVALGKKVEEDHMRNRQMVVHWLLANATDAVRKETRAGKTYYRVLDRDAFREGCGRLLAEVMRIKATGDFKAGKALVETYGTQIDRGLHEEVLGRLKALNMPALSAFVQPELRLVQDPAGKVTDVVVHYPMDLGTQMLRWSGRLK